MLPRVRPGGALAASTPARAAVVAVALVSCGRFQFAARDDASITSDVASDVTPDTVAADAPMLPQPVLWIPFDDGSLRDRISGDLGSCAECPTLIAGRVGASAALFDGIDDCVLYADRPGLRSAALTAAVWARAAPPGAMEVTIMTKPNDLAVAASNSWEMSRETSRIVSVYTYAGAFESWFTPVMLPDDEWHHVAYTFEAGTKRIYYDGVEAGTMQGGAMEYGADAFHLGCDRNGDVPGFFYGGAVDDVRIFDRALSAVEIAVLAAP